MFDDSAVSAQPKAVWLEVHERLRDIASRRSELDAEEARWLRKAEDLKIWRRFGCATALEYLERELGLAPRTARDRLRVARALGALSGLEACLRTGALKYSAVRELTRVATPSTERKWLDAVRGKNLRQIEELVAGHQPGDNPEDPIDPQQLCRTIHFEEISSQTQALLRQARTAIDDEHGEHLDDDRLLATLCRRAIESGGDSSGPRHQIAITVCKQCKRGWQLGGGRTLELDAAAIELAACDARHIGSLDANKPERAKADIPPATRRLVIQRDNGRCAYPGCRSARNLDLHHVVRRTDGGGHEPSNLCTLCFAHHQLAHFGLIEIDGQAPDQLTFLRRDEGARRKSEDRGSKWKAVEIETQTRDALVTAGFKATEARAAIKEAAAHVGHDVPLEAFVREALKRCRTLG